MLRLFTDFNTRTVDGACWNLIYHGLVADNDLLKEGEKVILFQDENDFEVEAVVEFRFIGDLGRDGWVAIPDWSTKRSINQ